MSYARSPRPVCSMTMGTKLAFIRVVFYSDSFEILPALPSTGNIFGHGLCGHFGLRQHQGQRPISSEATAKRVPRLRPVVECPDSLGCLLLALRQCVNFGIQCGVVDRDTPRRGDRVQDEIDAYVALGAGSYVGAQPIEKLRALGSLGDADVE